MKANFPVRLVGSVVSPEDARVAAGVAGTEAERLLGRGRLPAGGQGPDDPLPGSVRRRRRGGRDRRAPPRGRAAPPPVGLAAAGVPAGRRPDAVPRAEETAPAEQPHAAQASDTALRPLGKNADRRLQNRVWQPRPIMKKFVLPLMLAFGVTLAAIVGQRMSTDAMAVVIGVAVGVAASVPTSLLLVALLRRERAGAWRGEAPPSQPVTAPAAERDRVEPGRSAGATQRAALRATAAPRSGRTRRRHAPPARRGQRRRLERGRMVGSADCRMMRNRQEERDEN